MKIDVFLLSNHFPLILNYHHTSMWLIKASNSQSIFSILLSFLSVKHTAIPFQTQFIGPTFRSSSEGRCPLLNSLYLVLVILLIHK